MKSIKLLLIAFITLSSSCQNQAERTEITNINPEQMQALLKNKDVQLVDVRTVDEVEDGYIEEALNIVYDNDFGKKLSALHKDKPIIVYCRSGRRSVASAKILIEKGFQNIYNLDGGILQWKSEGYTVKKI